VKNLALTLRDLGRFEEAEGLFRRTIAGLEKAVGVDHPNTLSCFANLATVLQSKGCFEEAELYFRKCLEARTRVAT
jgi:tetratricopeptide (TPR) repeat protein